MTKELDKIHQNIEKRQKDERDKKCEPVAEEVLQIIARHKPSASIEDRDKQFKEYLNTYGPIYQDIGKLCMKKGLTIGEINYTMTIVLAFMQLTQQMVKSSIEENVRTAEEILWGKEGQDITLSDVDKIIKK